MCELQIGRLDPQCVVIVESVKDLEALAVFRFHYESFNELRNALSGHRFLLLRPWGYNRVDPDADQWKIFTHKLIHDKQQHECNQGAFQYPHDENGVSIRWRNKPFYEDIWNFEIYVDDIFVIDQKLGIPEEFRPRALKAEDIAVGPSTSARVPFDLNKLPEEGDSW